MGNLLKWNFWFSSRPDYLIASSQKILLGFVAFCLVVWVGTWLWSKKKNVNRKILGSFSSFGLSNAVIGFLLWFFAYERVPFLSARMWYIVWFIGLIVWLFFIYRQYKKIEVIKEQTAKENELKKYIP